MPEEKDANLYLRELQPPDTVPPQAPIEQMYTTNRFRLALAWVVGVFRHRAKYIKSTVDGSLFVNSIPFYGASEPTGRTLLYGAGGAKFPHDWGTAKRRAVVVTSYLLEGGQLYDADASNGVDRELGFVYQEQQFVAFCKGRYFTADNLSAESGQFTLLWWDLE